MGNTKHKGIFEIDPFQSVYIQYFMFQKPIITSYEWKPTIIENWKIYFSNGCIWQVKKHKNPYVKKFFTEKKEVLCEASQLYDYNNDNVFPFMIYEHQYPNVILCETFGSVPINVPNI